MKTSNSTRARFCWPPMTICGKNVDTLRPCKRSNRDFFWLWSTENTHILSSPVFLYITRGVLRCLLGFSALWGQKPCGGKYMNYSWNKTWKKIARHVRDLNPWPLRYRCSALPTELTNRLLIRNEMLLVSPLTLEESLQNGCAILNMRLLICVEASSWKVFTVRLARYFPELRS